MQEKVRRRDCARCREKRLERSVPREVAVDGGTVVTSDSLIESSRDVGKPFVFKAARFCGKVFIVLASHETGLIQHCKKALANVPKGFNDTWLDPLTSRGRIVAQLVLFTATSRDAWSGKGRHSVPFGQRVANRRIEQIFFPGGREGYYIHDGISGVFGLSSTGVILIIHGGSQQTFCEFRDRNFTSDL